ncbi:ComEA family DNA-binding protein [Nocardia sp. NBC_00416]|uniref:ComEA family DNA-binding protein n=1 Tax=Nocardia sp. NBC_00416 TaxID=2975991 RepID=UPI002E227DEC
MARDDERERVRRQLGGHLGAPPRSDPASGARPWPDAALTDGDDAVRTPRWLDDEPEPPGWRDRLIPGRFRGARLDAGRRGVVTMAGIALLAGLVTAVLVLWEHPVAQSVPPLPAANPAALSVDSPLPETPSTTPDSPPPPASPPASASAELVVSVVGLVHRAGLVRLPPGARVADAIAAAGGAFDGADLAGLNLAQRLVDGDQVRVGAGEPGSPPVGSATVSGGARGPASAAEPNSATPAAGIPVDLNAATEADLDALPGVGPVTAKAIVAWRETNGRFTDVEQLAEVDGIGPTRLARLRALVTV